MEIERNGGTRIAVNESTDQCDRSLGTAIIRPKACVSPARKCSQHVAIEHAVTATALNDHDIVRSSSNLQLKKRPYSSVDLLDLQFSCQEVIRRSAKQ